jgi:endonuclease/exonuclease/phosphatase family metal-dependent hydrolase
LIAVNCSALAGSPGDNEEKQTMRILSCNIRYMGGDDGDNRWDIRKDICFDVIKSHSPDIICCQEVWCGQFEDMAAAFPGYASFGMIDTCVGKNPMNTVFYRSDRFRHLSAGGYWLSEVPHVTGSISWDSLYVRLANWLRLEDRSSGKEFRVINTHLDNVGQTARERQAEVINHDAWVYPADYTQFLTGDMNCDTTNPAIHLFLSAGWQDTYEAVYGPGDPGHTLHKFEGDAYQSDIGKMDWIFFRGAAAVTGAEIIKETRNGHYPSDHYFIAADIDL